MIVSRNSGGNGSLVSASHSMVSSCSHSDVLCRLMVLTPFSYCAQKSGSGGSRSCESTINCSKNSNFLLSE